MRIVTKFSLMMWVFFLLSFSEARAENPFFKNIQTMPKSQSVQFLEKRLEFQLNSGVNLEFTKTLRLYLLYSGPTEPSVRNFIEEVNKKEKNAEKLKVSKALVLACMGVDGCFKHIKLFEKIRSTKIKKNLVKDLVQNLDFQSFDEFIGVFHDFVSFIGGNQPESAPLLVKTMTLMLSYGRYEFVKSKLWPRINKKPLSEELKLWPCIIEYFVDKNYKKGQSCFSEIGSPMAEILYAFSQYAVDPSVKIKTESKSALEKIIATNSNSYIQERALVTYILLDKKVSDKNIAKIKTLLQSRFDSRFAFEILALDRKMNFFSKTDRAHFTSRYQKEYKDSFGVKTMAGEYQVVDFRKFFGEKSISYQVLAVK